MTYEKAIAGNGHFKCSEGRSFYLQEATSYVKLIFHKGNNAVNETFEKVKAPFNIRFQKPFITVTVIDLSGSANTVLIQTSYEDIK